MNDSVGKRSANGAAESATTSPEIRALADELVPLFYDELRAIARRVRGAPSAGATLQTTALVNETYLKLRTTKGWDDESHFLNAAALAMRQVLVDSARERLAVKRGSGASPVTLGAADQVAAAVSTDETTIRLHDALNVLTKEAPRLGQIVECRYFGGFDDDTTARALKLSVRTVRRDWAIARAWLHRELQSSEG